MAVLTDSERVRHSRKMVLEFLGSSVDLSLRRPRPMAAGRIRRAVRRRPRALRTGGRAERGRRARRPPSRPPPRAGWAAAETVHQPVKVDNELYVRDYAKCVLCYKCVEACGVDAQNTFAIAVAGRGFDARISTEFDVGLADSACVYCGNCIGVCPTGALMFKSEHDLREAGDWDESAQTETETICPYCGVGCTLVPPRPGQPDRAVTSPMDHEVTVREPVHQGPVRVAVRAEPGRGVERGAFRRGRRRVVDRVSPPSRTGAPR